MWTDQNVKVHSLRSPVNFFLFFKMWFWPHQNDTLTGGGVNTQLCGKGDKIFMLLFRTVWTHGYTFAIKIASFYKQILAILLKNDHVTYVCQVTCIQTIFPLFLWYIWFFICETHVCIRNVYNLKFYLKGTGNTTELCCWQMCTCLLMLFGTIFINATEQPKWYCGNNAVKFFVDHASSHLTF